jgi:predicted nucleic acid-binding protein
MIAVADTSPLCYLILIHEVDLLRKLFSQVLVPPAVLAELLNESRRTRSVVQRAWRSSKPASRARSYLQNRPMPK